MPFWFFFFAYFMVGILAMVVLNVPIVGDLVIRRDTCQMISVNIMSRARSKWFWDIDRFT